MSYPPPGYGTPYAPPSAPPPPGYERYPPPQGYDGYPQHPPPPGYGGGYGQHHHHHHQPGGYQGYFNDGYPPPPPPPQPYPPTQVYHCEHSHHRDDGCFSFLRAVLLPSVAAVCWKNAASSCLALLGILPKLYGPLEVMSNYGHAHL